MRSVAIVELWEMSFWSDIARTRGGIGYKNTEEVGWSKHIYIV